MRGEPDPLIVTWLDGQSAQSVWTTSITVFEFRFGIERLVAGRRRDELQHEFERMLEDDLDGRVVPFDLSAAQAAGAIAAEQRRRRLTVEIRDVQIAGIARHRKATLATRNIKHFEGIGLALVNPWSG
jgi:predicted nucleic acid-binding protein